MKHSCRNGKRWNRSVSCEKKQHDEAITKYNNIARFALRNNAIFCIRICGREQLCIRLFVFFFSVIIRQQQAHAIGTAMMIRSILTKPLPYWRYAIHTHSHNAHVECAGLWLTDEKWFNYKPCSIDMLVCRWKRVWHSLMYLSYRITIPRYVVSLTMHTIQSNVQTIQLWQQW